MTTTPPLPDYHFGRFELKPAAQRLLVDGETATLGPRAFDLLVALLERAGQLVSKAELLDLVWPGLVVEENNLQVQVSALRKILGPGAITTVPGRGYRCSSSLRVCRRRRCPLRSCSSQPMRTRHRSPCCRSST
jgi:DNA-binding winged helix-turn-helix (wHTH) protein